MLKPSLQLRISQQLTMTPQLQQAIRLLQLPVMDLQAEIQEALEENLMLEIDESVEVEPSEPSLDNEATDPQDDPQEVEIATDTDWDTAPQSTEPERRKSDAPELTREQADRSGETLSEYLLWQLELEDLDARSFAIGRAIVDAISDDGYLTDELEAIRATLAPDVLATTEEIESVLRRIQKLDPAGVAARSLGECLHLQLDQLDPATEGLALAKNIAVNHLELVAEQQYSSLGRLLDASEDELQSALLLVRGCHPRPGSIVYTPPTDYVVPDVFVRRIDGKWVVELNNSVAPQLRINSMYANSLGRGEEYNVLKSQLKEARWLLRSLEIRNETLLKVAVTIVRRQTAFLEHGEEHMRPMVLKDIADAIEMHESTVSRVTANKYMHTPRGVFEFRYFFSSHVAGDQGDQSSIAVRAKIRKLIAAENPEKPLSDNQITNLLSEDGIKLARRTVAKYREALQIPSSSDRKRVNLTGTTGPKL